MEKMQKKSVEVLNDLLQVNNDRIENYTKASSEVHEEDLKNTFSQLVDDSNKCRQELINEIQKLGGTPVTGTSTSGKFYKAWMDVRTALTNNDRKTILRTCESSEDVAKNNYEDALKNKNLLPEFQGLVERQYNVIKAGHDKVKALRDALVNVNA
jgi:uncharacterized protein (TIGR02284 family)